MFVWTAVMQLVEQGLLDLDADVETYLDFELPDDSLGPVTLRHLLTHTPGFEDKALGLFSHDPADLRPPGEVLAQAGIKQVYPPGQISAYSNYGAGLAGYVVERVSGMPFEAYVEQNIFLPLGMEHSTFRQPLPEALAADMSVGYLFKNGQFAPQPFEIVQPAPAGSLSSTAVDMAAFMIALLQEGELDGERILQSETVQAMRSPQFQHAAGLDAWGYGFALSQIPEGGSFGHGGDTIYFHTEMTLLPQHGIGVFISTNTDTGSLARFDFMTAFLERYYGAKGFTAADPAGQGDPASLAAYAGTYYSARSNYTGLERILNLLQPLEVSVSPDGRLLVQGQFTAWPVAFVEQEPGRFLAADEGLPDRSPLVFAPAEEGGPVRYAYWSQLAFIKQPWYAQTGFMFLVLGVSLAGMVAALIGLPAGAWSRRVYARRLPPEERAPLSIPEGLMRWVAWTLALLVVLFYLAFMLFTADVNAAVRLSAGASGRAGAAIGHRRADSRSDRAGHHGLGAAVGDGGVPDRVHAAGAAGRGAGVVPGILEPAPGALEHVLLHQPHRPERIQPHRKASVLQGAVLAADQVLQRFGHGGQLQLHVLRRVRQVVDGQHGLALVAAQVGGHGR